MGEKYITTKMKSLVLPVILGVLALSLTVSATEEEEKVYDPQQKFLIGVRRTAVITTISTSTVTVGSTCYSKISTGTCSGKRKKRAVASQVVDVTADINDSGIDGSMSTPIEISDGKEDPGKLVIWTTSTTTITWYSSSTASGTTLTVNFSCT